MLHISAEELREAGIVQWGYTEEDRAHSWERFAQWLAKKREGSLHWLADERANKRIRLTNFYPDFQSALVFLFDYSKQRWALERFYKSAESNGLKMGSYVFAFEGEDYHHILQSHLEGILQHLCQRYSGLNGCLSVDVHPVLERDLAWRAGLGWFGKNSMLVSRTHGSFFLIGSLLLNQKLELSLPSSQEADHCGQCRACVDACPTAAIDPETRTLVAEQCLATFTIEHFKDDIPHPQGAQEKSPEIFGCDICQDVCPWNRRGEGEAVAHTEGKLTPFFLTRPVAKVVAQLAALSNKQFARLFAGTAIARTGRRGLLKNLKYFS